MRKGTVVQSKPKITKQYSIKAKSAEYIFCPANAIDYEFYHRDENILPELVTNDGVVHQCEFIGTWDNRDGVYEEEFDSICQRRYGVPFISVKSMWIGRLGKLDDYWHLIKLN